MAKTAINLVQKQAGRERHPLPGGRAGARAGCYDQRRQQPRLRRAPRCSWVPLRGGMLNPIPTRGRQRHVRSQRQRVSPNAGELQLYSPLDCISSSFSF